MYATFFIDIMYYLSLKSHLYLSAIRPVMGRVLIY